MTENSLKHVATLGNSIIGVSVLAMPFCFQQCGIILGIVMLMVSALLTRFNCHLLLKAALISRRKTFELLAFHAFGFHGKLAVETSIICFLLGILISFYVVIGDITPAIIGELLNIENNSSLRTLILTAVGLGVALPLGLLKNINSLGNISALSLCFYAFLIFKIFSDALPIMLSERWWDNIAFWQPRGILQCLPIFALAMSCQTQIFEIYDSVAEPSLGKMNRIIKLAMNLCVFVYVSVGFFGYIAFVNKDFSGNVLVNMPSTFLTEFIKLGFVLSVALSFPLVIFPCRTSLCSLLSKKAYIGLDVGNNYIPEFWFRTITISVVVVTLIMGILCPNIELVLGLVGSTIGTVICIIFPAILFIRVTSQNTFERVGAQVVLCAGIFLLVACTHVTIHKTDQEPLPLATDTGMPELLRKDIPVVVMEQQDKLNLQEKPLKLTEIYESPKIEKPVTVKQEKKEVKADKADEQRRLEPPIPQEPDSNNKMVAKVEHEEKKPEAVVAANPKVKPQQLPLEAKLDKEGVKKDNEQSQTQASKTKDVASKQEELLKKLEHQQQEQAKLIEEQKHLLEELKAHKESHHPAKDGNPAVIPNADDAKVATTAKVLVAETKPPRKTDVPLPTKTVLRIPEPKAEALKQDEQRHDPPLPVERDRVREVVDQAVRRNDSDKDAGVKLNAEGDVGREELAKTSKTLRLGSQTADEKKMEVRADVIANVQERIAAAEPRQKQEPVVRLEKRDTDSVVRDGPEVPPEKQPASGNDSGHQAVPKSVSANTTTVAVLDTNHADVQPKQNSGTNSPNMWRKDEQKR